MVKGLQRLFASPWRAEGICITAEAKSAGKHHYGIAVHREKPRHSADDSDGRSRILKGICYEAQARLSDPVYGCVSTILSLQQQVASLQAELSVVQSHLINSRLAAAASSSLHGSRQQMQQHNTVLQPAYSNTSSVSNNNAIDLSSFPPPGLDLPHASMPSRGTFDALQLSSRPPQDEDEEESRNTVAFIDGVFRQK
ncbi:LOB domain-containing protein 30-like [Asparagus officinalis]|uniref:LOB domain-containing protein 30-like n=1 Tax=Asparagus officinalis TaxID=4686 RepID=UPI00098E697A|nr:LOB domain-containing protein 30-like [Asparagus officinalis]